MKTLSTPITSNVADAEIKYLPTKTDQRDSLLDFAIFF
jgi:hypothetical protein